MNVADADDRHGGSRRCSPVDSFNYLTTASGGIARLRECILSLAVSGQLSTHGIGDQGIRSPPKDASVEEQAFTSAIVGHAPFPVPSNWVWMPMSALVTEYQNGASSRGDAGGRSVVVIRLADVKDGAITLRDPRTLSIRASDISKYKLQTGDILAIRVNGSEDLVGRFVLCREALDAIYCDHFIRVRIDQRLVTPEFLRLVGDSNVIRERIRSLFITTAGQKTVNQGHIGSLLIPLPPLAEQACIVVRVEELMKLCDALEENGRLEAEQHARLVSTLFDTLAASESPQALTQNWQRIAQYFDLLLDRPEAVDALEQTILQLAMRGMLVPQDPNDEPADSIIVASRAFIDGLVNRKKISRPKELPPIGSEPTPFPIPLGWAFVRLGEIMRISSGDGLTAKDMKEGLVPVYGGNGVAGYHDAANVTRQTLVIGRVGFYCGSVHITPVSAWITDNAFVTTFDERHLDIEFLYWLLKATNLRARDSGTAQPVISGSKVYSIVLAIPPLAEQHRIVARVKKLRELCAQLRERLTSKSNTQARLAEAIVSTVVSPTE